jgi:hypothetical protein
MGQLFAKIRKLVASGKYVVSEHAVERLEERGILEWQVVYAIEDGELMAERSNDKPHPVVEVNEVLADGSQVKAVWSLLAQSGVAKLVTVHYIDGD